MVKFTFCTVCPIRTMGINMRLFHFTIHSCFFLKVNYELLAPSIIIFTTFNPPSPQGFCLRGGGHRTPIDFPLPLEKFCGAARHPQTWLV